MSIQDLSITGRPMKVDSCSKTLSAVLLVCALLGGSGALGQTLEGGFSAVPKVDCDQDFGNACGDDINRSCTTPATDSRLLTGFLVQCPVGFQGSYVSNRHYVQTCGEGNYPGSWAGGYYDLVEAQAECLPLNTAVPPQTVCADRASLQTDGTCACNAGHADVDGDALACVPCPANSTVSTDGGTCVCDAGYEYDDPDDPQSCLEECPSGASRDDAGICRCPTGQEEFSDGCAVPATCRDDQSRTEANTCACPEGEQEFQGPPAFCAVPADCSGGRTPDPDQNNCVCEAGQFEESTIREGVCSVCSEVQSEISLTESCACDTAGEVPTGTWGSQVDPPRCCTSAAFTAPDKEAIPSINRNNDFVVNTKGQDLWGSAKIGKPTDKTVSLECVCTSSGTFRVEGYVRQGPGSEIKVSQKVRGLHGCRNAGREPQNKSRTETHETLHATMLIESINEFWGNLGIEYTKEAACEAVIDRIVGTAGRLNSAYDDELNRQLNHEDHRGDPRYTSICPGRGKKMEEIQCTQSLCPGQTTY